MNRVARVLLSAIGVMAVAVLAVGTARTTDARFIGATTASATVEAGEVDLVAGTDSPTPLVGLDLLPDAAVTSCYLLRYDGTIADVEVELLVDVIASTGLDDHVILTVERGTGATDSSCAGFVADETVLTARLAELTPDVAPSRPIWAARDRGDETWMKVTADLDDDPIVAGKSVDFILLWRAEP